LAQLRAGRLRFCGCPGRPGAFPSRPSSRPRVRPEEIVTVAATCDVCGKGPGFGHAISHSHRRTKRRFNPNIQTVRAMVGKTGKTPKKLNVCTSCLKAGKVSR
jgi:large subunit ribosomal protein L28